MRPTLPDMPSGPFLHSLPSATKLDIAPGSTGGNLAFPDLLVGLQAADHVAGAPNTQSEQKMPEAAQPASFHLQLPTDQIMASGKSFPITGTPLPDGRTMDAMDGEPIQGVTEDSLAPNKDAPSTIEPIADNEDIDGDSAPALPAIIAPLAQDKTQLIDLAPKVRTRADLLTNSKSTQAQEKVVGSDRAQPALAILPITDPAEAEFKVSLASPPSNAALAGASAPEDATQQSLSSPANNAPGPAPATAVQALAAIAPVTAEPAATAPVEHRIEGKLGVQIEQAIDQVSNARENARAARPEMTVRHHEFGAVTMRLDATGSDLRATLSSRDPGFVPAIQAALADRFVSAAAESGAAQNQAQSQSQSQAQSQPQSHSQRAQDQLSQNGGSSGSSANNLSGGGGAMGDPRYGSSPGSGQASSQPYLDQTGANEDDRAAGNPPGFTDNGARGLRDQGLFA